MSDTLHIGVGLDTARYGHHATFLRPDCQPAAKPLPFLESRAGYQQFEAVLRQLADRYGDVHFHIRLDAAGQYAVNLEAFLRRLELPKTISIGEPKRNKDYKNAHYPKRKADAVDSRACARFAVVERPTATPETPTAFVQLRDVASALAGQRKQTTQQLNRLHNHLARVFPELATVAPKLGADWLLTLLARYPSAARIAAARPEALAKIPYLRVDQATKLQAAARSSTASLCGPLAEALVRQLVDAVRHSQQAEKRLGQLLDEAYDALPPGGHRQVQSILGIGKRTAAALVAKIVVIDRFPTAAALVGYFGVFPEENTSGVDKHGRPLPQGTRPMSLKGNDLVRGYLWMACLSGVQSNPALRALYARQRAAGKAGGVALGHCMRKLLHLVFAVWKTDRPFDPQHYPWEPAGDTAAGGKDAAGRKGQSPERPAVTAAPMPLGTRSVPPAADAAKKSQESAATPRTTGRRIDFAQLRRQIPLAEVLRQLGLFERLQGRGAQRRGPCPLHEPQRLTGRSFSVNLDKHVFRCLHPQCAAAGNVLDFWAAVHRLPLRDAALHLADTFHLSHQPHAKEASP